MSLWYKCVLRQPNPHYSARRLDAIFKAIYQLQFQMLPGDECYTVVHKHGCPGIESGCTCDPAPTVIYVPLPGYDCTEVR